MYKTDKEIFMAGSLVEPTSVAYNAVIERGGGIRPGDNVVICGGGPVGVAACAILKKTGRGESHTFRARRRTRRTWQKKWVLTS